MFVPDSQKDSSLRPPGIHFTVAAKLQLLRAFREYFWHTRAAIGHAAARVVAQRVHLAEYTLRRFCAAPHTQDDLLFPPSAPPGTVSKWLRTARVL